MIPCHSSSVRSGEGTGAGAAKEGMMARGRAKMMENERNFILMEVELKG